jgi:pimeloyl-ACP methyl ester carboxylesterase
MIEHPLGNIDYDERGTGPTTLVLVPGSWSTGSAWRAVTAALSGDHRLVTTSLLGYGNTVERRTEHDTSLDREAEILECVVERAGGPVHLVGHSFGGLVSLAVARRARVDVTSLTVLESTSFDSLPPAGEDELFTEVLTMSTEYARAFERGEREAARRVIDFYGGNGSFDALPQRMRDYVVATTPSNIVDWASVFGSRVSLAELGRITVPTLVVRGENAHRCVAKAAEAVAGALPNARLDTLAGASHFMMSTHPAEVAALVEAHVRDASSAA